MTENVGLTDFVFWSEKAATTENGSGKGSSINDVTDF